MPYKTTSFGTKLIKPPNVYSVLAHVHQQYTHSLHLVESAEGGGGCRGCQSTKVFYTQSWFTKPSLACCLLVKYAITST